LRTKDLKVARPHGASVVGNCRVRIFNDDLAFRLIVERPFIQALRNNVIVFITPVAETDGRDKDIDTYWLRGFRGLTRFSGGKTRLVILGR
jgi:hypothetical protein